MKDSLFNEQSAKVLQEMETKYQSEKKQQEIEKQSLKIEKQAAQSRSDRIMLWAMLGGLLLVVLIAVQVYRGYRQKKKANALLFEKNIEIEEKNTNLNQANVEITSQKAEIEEKNLNIMDSIRYAKRIQLTILPRDTFVEKHLPESFILYKPKDIVSGDFYWMEKQRNKIYISAVDCTGHGVPGAFVSIVGYNSLNRTIMEFKLTKPSDILMKLNDLVVDTFVRHSDSDVKDGMDMSLLSLDTDTKAIEFSGAQNPLYIVNEDGLIEIKGNKQPIGSSLEPKVFDNHEIIPKKGDMLYLFTDGYIDQFGGPKGKKFMRKRFKELLQSIHKMDVKTQKLHLDNTIKDWMKEEEQLDDILVIGIRV
jgi:serine phosphatase RsbU (regulator of sigma subunit)